MLARLLFLTSSILSILMAIVPISSHVEVRRQWLLLFLEELVLGELAEIRNIVEDVLRAEAIIEGRRQRTKQEEGEGKYTQ